MIVYSWGRIYVLTRVNRMKIGCVERKQRNFTLHHSRQAALVALACN